VALDGGWVTLDAFVVTSGRSVLVCDDPEHADEPISARQTIAVRGTTLLRITAEWVATDRESA
jgi:hypothetical protein